MVDEVTTFNRFNSMVETIPNPTVIWTLFINHLNDVIGDCNTILNPPTRNYKKKMTKTEGPKMSIKDLAVCSNVMTMTSTTNACLNVDAGSCPDD